MYQQYGVLEYDVYDPDNGPLSGWLRASDRLVAMPEMADFVSPRLQIRFDPGDGPDNLRIFGPDGTRFLTFAERVQKAKADQRYDVFWLTSFWKSGVSWHRPK